MTIDWQHQSLPGLALFVTTGALLGLAGRRWRWMRLALVVVPLIWAAVPLLYYTLEGSVSECVGAGATFRCTEETYASEWGAGEWAVVGVVVFLTLAPIVSAALRGRLPSILAAIGLPLLLAIYPGFLWAWVPAWAAVLAAAIAGPPSRASDSKAKADL